MGRRCPCCLLYTSRQCYLNLKREIGEEQALRHPARYALCELVNLHDDSLQFEAVHRVLFGADPENVVAEFFKMFPPDAPKAGIPQQITFVTGDNLQPVFIHNPIKNLAVGNLQLFLDDYVKKHSCEIDYIHGEDVVRSLCRKKGSIGFLLPSMDKNDLFKTVILDAKSFSWGCIRLRTGCVILEIVCRKPDCTVDDRFCLLYTSRCV